MSEQEKKAMLQRLLAIVNLLQKAPHVQKPPVRKGGRRHG
jgi:hypothetical protein